jgi:hypothetical protein
MIKKFLFVTTLVASLAYANVSAPSIIGKWKADKLPGTEKGTTISALYNFTKSKCYCLYKYKSAELSYNFNAVYDYTIDDTAIVMTFRSVKIDPKSLPKEYLPTISEMTKAMQKEMKSEPGGDVEPYELKGNTLTLKEPTGDIVLRKVK